MSKTLTVKGLNRVKKMLDVNYFNSITSDEWNETNRKRGIMNKGIVIKEGERLTTKEFEGGNFPSSIFGHPVHHKELWRPITITGTLTDVEINNLKSALLDTMPHHHNAPCQLIPITTEEGKQTKEDKARVRALEIQNRNKRQVNYLHSIQEVIFHDPHTTIVFEDRKVTVKTMRGDEFDKTIGFYAAVAKDLFGDHFIYRDLVKGAKVFEPGYLEVARTKSRANRKKERQAGAPARAKRAKAREKQAQKVKKARLANKKAGK